MMRPNAPARPSDRARAALLGWKPISWAMARIRSRVAADTPGCPFSAKDTAALVTPARRAMSAMVGRFTDSSRRRRLPGTLAARPAPWAPAPALASVTSALRNVRTAAPAVGGRSQSPLTLNRYSVSISVALGALSPTPPERGAFRMHRNAAKLTAGGRPASWLGVNFWSRTGGPLMWRNYDPDAIRAELGVLRAHGLSMTRSFFYWPDFMPEPYRIDEDMTARFGDFLDRHAEAGLTTVPTFLVGHMSGENWDPAWRAGRDLYADVWMVAREAWFAGEMVRRFAGHEAVCGWLVSNEMPIYGGAAPRETIAAWAQIILSAVRAAGGTQPVSLGDGAWGLEVSGRDNGFSVADSARQCDFVGPHVYPVGDDLVRQHYAAAWACELASTYGTPVILEEFGVSSDFVSDASAAHYYRQVLHNSLLAGATGWIAWNNTDYDGLAGQDPYRHHAFEMHFGLTDARGAAKPQLAEMATFGETLDQVGFGDCQRSASDAALVIPSYLDTVYPFTVEEDRTYLAEVLRQAYVSARLADLPPALTRESTGIGQDARLYLVPSAKQLLSPTWHQLEALAEGGAVVYVSYSPGAHGVHAGPWFARLNGMFGVQHELGYGAPARTEDGPVTFTLAQDFGTLPQGAQLRSPRLAAGRAAATCRSGRTAPRCSRWTARTGPRCWCAARARGR